MNNKINYGSRQTLGNPEKIHHLLRVDEEGNLWWKVHGPGKNILKPAGSRTANGYWQVNIGGYPIAGHVLAWCLYYGHWPAAGMDIDHINGDKTDNRKSNLREVSRSHNNLNRKELHVNNSSGQPGVVWDATRNKWKAQLGYKGKNIQVRCSSFEEAVQARKQMEQKVWQEVRSD